MNISGMGSGINWEQMVNAIVSQEKAPKEGQILRQEARNSSEIKALKDIQKEINSLNRTARKLNFTREFTKTKASTNDDTIAGVTSASNAIAGEYNFTVEKLALTQRDRLLQVSEGATFDSGTIKFTGDKSGKAVVVDIAALSVAKGSALTVEEVQAAVNKEADKQGVEAKATLVRSKGEINLVLNAGDTGTDHQFTVNSTLTTASSGSIIAGHGSLQVAQDAQVKFGAMTLTSSSNKMENVVDGISLELKKAGTVNVKIEQDNDKSKETIKTFIDEYNKVLDAVTKHTSVKDGNKPALGSNASVRGMVSSLRQAISESYSVSSFGTLAQLGITTNRDGKLEIDDKKLDKALADDADGVAKLLAGDTTQDGVMDKLTEQLSSYKGNGGLYSQRINSLETNNTRLKKQLDDLDSRMLKRAKSLRSYYATMESRIASLKQSQMSLASLV